MKEARLSEAIIYKSILPVVTTSTQDAPLFLYFSCVIFERAEYIDVVRPHIAEQTRLQKLIRQSQLIVSGALYMITSV
jgi:hypothetical protein